MEVQPADLLEQYTYNVAGTDYLQLRLNGVNIGKADGTYYTTGQFNLTAAGVALTGSHGFLGSGTSTRIDSWTQSRSDAQNWLSLVMPVRVLPWTPMAPRRPGT